jgi:hypothetical protein
MPLAAPVMTATFPSKRLLISQFRKVTARHAAGLIF